MYTLATLQSTQGHDERIEIAKLLTAANVQLLKQLQVNDAGFHYHYLAKTMINHWLKFKCTHILSLFRYKLSIEWDKRCVDRISDCVLEKKHFSFSFNHFCEELDSLQQIIVISFGIRAPTKTNNKMNVLRTLCFNVWNKNQSKNANYHPTH